MSIFVDQVKTHDGSNTGDDTQPPGIDGLDWCHIISTVSWADLLGFLTANFLTIGQDPANIRQPSGGSIQTYAALTADMRTAAIAAGARTGRQTTVAEAGFDAPASGPPFYEP